MLVIVKFATETDADPAQRGDARLAFVRSMTGADMQRMSDTDSLRDYFWIDVAEPAAAARLAQRLREIPGVEAAYVKPPDESP